MDAERWEQRHRERMERRRARFAAGYRGRSAFGGMFLGLAVIAVGVLFLLRNVGVLYFDDIWQFWPVILIAIGVSRLTHPHSASTVTSGLIIGGIGVVFLLRNLGYIYGNVWEYVWPGILIAVGLSMLVRHLEGRDRVQAQGSAPFAPGSGFTATSSSNNSLYAEVVFSGTRQKIDSQDFEGGRVTAVFGGAEIDLRSAGTKREEIAIKAEAIFGGIELWVPAHWQTIVRGTGVFGGFEDKTFPATLGAPGNPPRLLITGAAVFGGVVVRN